MLPNKNSLSSPASAPFAREGRGPRWQTPSRYFLPGSPSPRFARPGMTGCFFSNNFKALKNSSTQPLTEKKQFLHPRDAGIRLHVRPQSRSRGGFGAPAAPPSGGRGARFFVEQLCCRTHQGGSQTRQPQRLQARQLWRQTPCGQARHPHLYAGDRRVLRRDRPLVPCARRSCRNRPVHRGDDSALAACGYLGMDGGR